MWMLLKVDVGNKKYTKKIKFRIAVKPFAPTGGKDDLSLTVELLRCDTIAQHLVKSAAC